MLIFTTTTWWLHSNSRKKEGLLYYAMSICLYKSSMTHQVYISLSHLDKEDIVSNIVWAKKILIFLIHRGKSAFSKDSCIIYPRKKDTYRPSKRSAWNSWTVEIIINVYYELGYSTLSGKIEEDCLNGIPISFGEILNLYLSKQHWIVYSAQNIWRIRKYWMSHSENMRYLQKFKRIFLTSFNKKVPLGECKLFTSCFFTFLYQLMLKNKCFGTVP